MIGSAPKPQHLLPALRRLGLPLGQWYLARWMLLGLLLMSFPACRQRAVTELYVEQMAQRNRALEDLVYDFDAENRSMEFELEDLRRTNAQLQGRLQEIQRQTSRIDTSPSDRPLMIRPESQKPESQKPESPKSRGGAPAPLKLPSGRKRDDESLILEPPEIVVPKQATEPILPAPDPIAPKSPAPNALAPKSLPPSSLVPEPQVREPQAIDPQMRREPSEDLLPELGPPSLKTPELKTPELKIPELKTPEFKTPEFKIPDASLPAVPGIESGSILERAPRGLPSGDSEASLLDRKIQLPASTAPGVGPSGIAAPVIQTSAVQALEARGKSGRIPTKPTDSRVREIDWHPTMCRAQNSDGKQGDDGLFLVLIPRNTAGQFVPSLGALTLVVEETLADGSVARIGRYEFSDAELKDYLEPVGSAPGLHIPIRWTEQRPAGTSVDVYAKLTMPDGSTMVNRRTIPLRKTAGMGPSTWTPR